MPHKKNPDVWELIRAKGNKLQAVPNELALLLSNLPSGYHRDFQLTKEIIINAVVSIQQMLEVANYSISKIQVRKNILDDTKYNSLFTVDTLNELVQKGIPFRDAYMQVSTQIAGNSYVRPSSMPHTHLGSIGNPGIQEIHERLQVTVKSAEIR